VPSFSFKDLTGFVTKSFGFLKPVRPADRLLAFMILLLFVLVLWGSSLWAVVLFLLGAYGFIFLLGQREVDFHNLKIDKALTRQHDLDVQSATQRENALKRIARDAAMLIEHNLDTKNNAVAHDSSSANKPGVTKVRRAKLKKTTGHEDQR
jgi:Flp pilus assembly protein TadB